MSGQLYELRQEIAAQLIASSEWTAAEILIKRRSDIWNAVATAITVSEARRCVVVGIARGTVATDQNKRARKLRQELTITMTLIELPQLDDSDSSAEQEDQIWESMVRVLTGASLGRSEAHYWLEYQGFEEIPDPDRQYVMRQTTFKTEMLIEL
jgi:hypothetical protein